MPSPPIHISLCCSQAAASLRVLQEEAPELLQAAAPAASPGAAPSPAPLPSYERLPPGNMTARNIFQDAWEVFESMGEVCWGHASATAAPPSGHPSEDAITRSSPHIAAQQALDWAFGDICVYGQNCGQNCVSDSYDVGDDLDHACYVHDRCLDPNSEYAKERCECHRDLQDAAEEVRSMQPASAVGK